jgi:hypothetical protein
MAPLRSSSQIPAKDVAHFGQFIAWTTWIAFIFGGVDVATGYE